MQPLQDDALDRFVDAQHAVYAQVLAELVAGRKRTHWMWFVFPQMRGLGHSAMAQAYGLVSLDEAVRYAAHPLLGKRLRQCTCLVLAADDKTAHQIFGSPDDLKLRSCMTLFHRAAPHEPVFVQAIGRLFGGELDARTLELLQPGTPGRGQGA